jgi:hypothetical protein
MKKTLITLSIIFLTVYAFAQEKTIFHEYIPTASSWDIIKWNLKDTTNVIWTLKEIVDEKGRVKELDFLKNGKVIDDNLCYLANRVTYEYKKGQIIEKLFQSEEEFLTTDCEMPYKSIYYLDSSNYIFKIERFAKYDFSGMDSTQIKQWKEWVPELKVLTPDSTQLEIDYYYYSFAKLNGIYPTSKNYKLANNYFHGDEPEKSSIINGIKKLKKTNR